MTTLPPRSFPSAFNGTGVRMLHPRIAVWFVAKSDYQLYDVNRDDWPVVRLTPTNSSRTTPYYFAEGVGENRSRTITVYRPRARIHSHVDMAIWHTGGWLCRKHGNQLEPVVPLLAVSDPNKLIWSGNVGLHRDTEEFREWAQFQTPFFYRPIIHNRLIARASRWEPEDETDTPTIPALPTIDPVPLFVAEALLEKAVAAEELCPISMESLAKGDALVTSCFHIFQRDAMAKWQVTHSTCPVCKKECAITEC
jgi:hypothetical protein